VWGTRLVREGAVAEPLELMPEEQPPRLAPVSARRWHDGSLVFDGLDFEGEAEDGARRALEEGQSLSGVKGVGAALRAAFGYALLEAASRTLRIRFAPAEVRTRVLAVAEGGREAAEACLRGLSVEREARLREEARRVAEREARAREELREAQTREYRSGVVAEARARVELQAAERRAYTAGLVAEAQQRVAEREANVGRWVPQAQRAGARQWSGREDAVERAERALERAGARLKDARRLANNQLEVTYAFMGERFISIVDGDSLRVRDAGVCLAGADSEVTLESLPAVIREAIDEGVLHITRYA
jgi:hypothetical protein